MFEKVISGGQTGVDRAALDVALELGVPTGGWCPKGRKAEDGSLASRYPLTETPSEEYWQRTEWNVRDSDGTLVLTRGVPTEGTAYTIEVARKLGKPCLVQYLTQAPSESAVKAWVDEHKVRVLNVAGPRESKCPGIYAQASQFLRTILSP
jgi:predicted Rossmann-fold nucleotide-binding protein